jgi:hypothetical protein
MNPNRALCEKGDFTRIADTEPGHTRIPATFLRVEVPV